MSWFVFQYVLNNTNAFVILIPCLIYTDVHCKSSIFELLLTGLQQTVERQLFKFRRYDFLWKDDMHALYQAFVESDPGTTMFKLEVERLQSIEQDVLEIPGQLTVGSVCLNTSPIKDSLHGFAVAWKMRYSTQLHEEAKVGFPPVV